VGPAGCFRQPQPLGSIIVKVIYRILLQVLPIVIIAHEVLRVFVAAHRLHLAVGEPLIEHPRDGHPPQVMRRELPYPAVITPSTHDEMNHPRREGPGELLCPVVDERLKEKGIISIAVQIPPLTSAN